jgi:CubicO group peptidase (beta-lactamase class C family)
VKWIIVGIAFFGLMLDVTIGPSTAEGAESSAAVLQEMNTFFEHAVDGGKLPGVIAVIARKGEITHASSSGYSSSGDPTTTLATLPDTIFRLFSMSKPVTAAAVMLLLDQGLIQLDDPVSNYLPEYTNMKVLKKGQLVTAASPITIRHLLTHTFCRRL